MSRLLDRLTNELTSHPIDRSWAQIKSRIAIYLCQKGDLELARREIVAIREWIGDGKDAFGTIYVNIAEATLAYQLGNSQEAVVKSRRAYAMSSLVSMASVRSISSAWLSHLEFNEGNFGLAVSLAGESLRSAAGVDYCAVARASCVVADILSLFGRFEKAVSWYKKARDAALSDGDEIMMGQILYNSAAFQLNSLRISNMVEPRALQDLSFTNLLVDSTANYDSGVQSTALPSLLITLKAQLLALRGDFAAAVSLFERCFGVESLVGERRLAPLYRADYAWCLMNLGDVDAAKEHMTALTDDLVLRLPCDESAMINIRLSQLHKMIGGYEMAKLYELLAAASLERHQLEGMTVIHQIERELEAI